MSVGRRPAVDAAALARLGNVRLRVQRVLEGVMVGRHRALRRGSSVEFAEHKEYAPGDDLRRLDWKVYGRHDRFYIRQYEDETNLAAYLALDCSASMGYGAPLSKFDYGRVLVGSLAYLLTQQHDQPALLAFGDRVRSYLPPGGRSVQLAPLWEALDDLRPSGQTDFEPAVLRLTEVVKRRSLFVVVSDLFDPTGRALSLLARLSARGHLVCLVHLLHQDELSFPFQDVTLFEAMESSQRLYVDPGAVRGRYQRALSTFLAQSASRCREARIRYYRTQTAERLDTVLLKLLRGTDGEAVAG